MKTDLVTAYQHCQQLAAGHYENFPVASILLPKKLRRPISVIYAFARTADDFADEGDAATEIRLAQLAEFDDALHKIATVSYRGNDPIFIALADVIKQHDLPINLFHDLLDAFKQDVVQQRYQNFNEVLDYCRRSANPVGRLLLHLSSKPNEQQLQQSDAICSALQLINFYQDIEQDLIESNRIYIPIDEMLQYEISEQQLLAHKTTKNAPLLRLQHQRAHALMQQGFELGTQLTGRIGWEVRAMTLGGIMTLNKLMAQADNNLLSRPRLSKLDFCKIMLFSATPLCYQHFAKQWLSDCQ